MAGATRLELATSCVTGKHSNQTELRPQNKKGFNKMLKPLLLVAGVTRLELATSCVTGKRSNQTELHPRSSLFSGGRCRA